MKVYDIKNKQRKKLWDDLQIVVIDSFYDTLDQSDSVGWLGKLFQFKIKSYQETYPYGILPFGETDIVGVHWSLCRKLEGNNLQPLMSFKTVDSQRTDMFRLEFPAFALLNAPTEAAHKAAVELELERAQQGKFSLGYLGSWCIDPLVRKDPALADLCRKVSAGLYCHWINQFNIQTGIAFAIKKFHVERFHAYLGMERLNGASGEYLPDFMPAPTFGEQTCVSVIYRKNLSPAANQDMIDIQRLWDDRLVIAGQSSPLWIDSAEKKAA